MLTGIDVYQGNGAVHWEAVKRAGCSFGIAKASEGLQERDALFAHNIQGMRTAGLVRGAYHFYRAEDDGKAQALHFLKTLEEAGFHFANDLPPALDLEDRAGAQAVGKHGLQEGVTAFLEEVKRAAGKLPVIYCDRFFWEEWMDGTDGFCGHPLWLAEFTTALAPILPHGFTRWSFWQRRTQTGFPGVEEGEADLNCFCGSLAELQRLGR